MTDDLDYLKAEAERLPNGTAARFLAALDAMDGATEPAPATVTVKISREDAEHWAQHHPRAIGQYEQRIANAVRAALEGER